jgi:hypothetical protein
VNKDRVEKNMARSFIKLIFHVAYEVLRHVSAAPRHGLGSRGALKRSNLDLSHPAWVFQPMKAAIHIGTDRKLPGKYGFTIVLLYECLSIYTGIY